MAVEKFARAINPFAGRRRGCIVLHERLDQICVSDCSRVVGGINIVYSKCAARV